jgi:alkylation response protein AidB-like acyl-CoA dehydrogenase
LTPDTAASIFKDPLACLAGSGSIGGVAVPTESGYQISGHWSHATGAPHATIFTANCKIEKGDQPSISEEGEPLVRPFWFWRGEVSVEANWKTIGMIATSSNSFSIDALSVPQERCFEIDPRKAILPHLVFRFPFQQFAEATLAVNSAGMARHFIDCCEKLVRYRNSESPMSIVLSQKMNQAQEDLELARASFYRTVSEAWTALEEEQEVSQSIFQQVSLVSRHLAAIARELVDGLYPYCGLYAANPETMINRIWRDLHTASQHSLLHKIS